MFKRPICFKLAQPEDLNEKMQKWLFYS